MQTTAEESTWMEPDSEDFLKEEMLQLSPEGKPGSSAGYLKLKYGQEMATSIFRSNFKSSRVNSC